MTVRCVVGDSRRAAGFVSWIAEPDMNHTTQEHRPSSFTLGLLAGTAVGAGLTMWLAPRVTAELRGRIEDAVESFADRAATRFEAASTQVAAMADEIGARRARVRNGIADAVAQGAHEVELRALRARTDRPVVSS
jgi:gas vesicle protein